jgi:DNA-binding transcriptional LysR family regulator
LLEGARRTLAEADRAVAAARRTGAGQQGQLRLAFSWSARFETLPALGRAFRRLSPDVDLLTQEMWNAPMSEALLVGQVDLGIALCPELAPGLAGEPVRRERLVAVLPAAHPRAAAGPVGVRELAAETFVMFPRELGPRLYDALVEICRGAGFEPTLRNDSFHTSWDLSLLGGIALAPASVSLGAPDGLSCVEVSDRHAELETRLVWRADNTSPAVRAFREAAAGAF